MVVCRMIATARRKENALLVPAAGQNNAGALAGCALQRLEDVNVDPLGVFSVAAGLTNVAWPIEIEYMLLLCEVLGICEHVWITICRMGRLGSQGCWAP